MNLSTLKPADGSTKKRKRIGRGQGSGYLAHLHAVIKERNLVQDIVVKWVLREVKCLYNAAYRK